VVGFNAYICKGVGADTIFLNLGHGRLIFMIDQDTRRIVIPDYEMFQELKSHDTNKCELVTEQEAERYGIKITRLYNVVFESHYRYNIYRFSTNKHKIYILERYDMLGDIYSYQLFSDFEDALAEIYD
jgi:hypothetical protein